MTRLPDMSGDKLVPGEPEILLDPGIPITRWVLDKVITVPYEHLPKPVSFAYFVTVGVPIIAVGALGGFAADKVNHWIVHPLASLFNGVAAAVRELEDGTSAMGPQWHMPDHHLGPGGFGGGPSAASAKSTERGEEERASDPDDADPHKPAPGGGVLLRAEDAPPTADPEPSQAHEPGWGVLLAPEERAQRERAETGGATTRAEAHREPAPPPEPPPTRHIDPPSQSGPDADTEPRRGDDDAAGDAGGPAMQAPTSGQAAPAPEPEAPSSAQGAVPASTHGDEQPAPPAAQHGDATPAAEEPYPTAGEASQAADEPEQPYPTAGETTQTREDGDYPMPGSDPVPAVEAAPPEPEPQPAEEAPAEEAEGD